MMYQLQPKLIVNNRAAAFCGPNTPLDKMAPTPELGKMVKGDYATPQDQVHQGGNPQRQAAAAVVAPAHHGFRPEVI